MGGKSMKQSWSAADIERRIMKMRSKPRTAKKLSSAFGGEKDDTKKAKSKRQE